MHPEIDGLIGDLKKRDLAALAGHMGNLLETVTIKEYPVIDTIKQTMRKNGALGAMMSGSGPTVFGIFSDKDAAEAAEREIRSKQLAKQTYITRPYNL